MALGAFLERELTDVKSGNVSSVNCCRADLEAFVLELGLAPAKLPGGWQQLCPEPEDL